MKPETDLEGRLIFYKELFGLLGEEHTEGLQHISASFACHAPPGYMAHFKTTAMQTKECHLPSSSSFNILIGV